MTHFNFIFIKKNVDLSTPYSHDSSYSWYLFAVEAIKDERGSCQGEYVFRVDDDRPR